MKGITAGTLTRTIILFLALVNQFLSLKGMSPILIDNAELSEFIAYAFTLVATLVAWWKNNSFTKKAIEADKCLIKLKQ